MNLFHPTMRDKILHGLIIITNSLNKHTELNRICSLPCLLRSTLSSSRCSWCSFCRQGSILSKQYSNSFLVSSSERAGFSCHEKGHHITRNFKWTENYPWPAVNVQYRAWGPVMHLTSYCVVNGALYLINMRTGKCAHHSRPTATKAGLAIAVPATKWAILNHVFKSHQRVPGQQ